MRALYPASTIYFTLAFILLSVQGTPQRGLGKWLSSRFFAATPTAPITKDPFPFATAYKEKVDVMQKELRATWDAIRPSFQYVSAPISTQLTFWPDFTRGPGDTDGSFYPLNFTEDEALDDQREKLLTGFIGHRVWREMYALCCPDDNEACRADLMQAPLAGDWSAIVLAHMGGNTTAQHAPQLLAKLVSGMQALVSVTTCQDETYLTEQNRTDCLARKVKPFEANLFFLAAFTQQGLRASAHRWPNWEALQAWAIDRSIPIHMTELQRVLRRLPLADVPAVNVAAFQASDIAFLRERMKSLRQIIEYDPATTRGIFCHDCQAHADLQLSAIGTIFDLLFTATKDPIPPYRLQALLLLTQYSKAATEAGGYPSGLTVPDDVAQRGTFIKERLMELQQEQMRALLRSSPWGQLKQRFSQGGVRRQIGLFNSAGYVTSTPAWHHRGLALLASMMGAM